MALPTSGQLSMNDINRELNRTGTAFISLDNAESGTYGSINTNSSSRPNNARPAAISEWYGYNHDAAPPLTVTPSSVSLSSNFSSFSINIKTPGSWTYSDNRSWINTNTQSGSGNSTITVFVQNNFSGITRFGTVTIRSGGATRFVSVRQAGSSGGIRF